MLTLAILIPIFSAGVLMGWRAADARTARLFAIAISLVPLLLLLAVWAGFDTGSQAPGSGRYGWFAAQRDWACADAMR